MHNALKAAYAGIKKGNSPFGACIVQNGQVVASVHNVVWQNTDITAHAEIHALRAACKKLKTIKLDACEIYSTTEPCPMCFSAIHWAGIKTIYFGTSISDVKKLGFSELTVSNKEMKKRGKSKVNVVEGVEKNACLELLKEWKKGKGKTY